MQVMVTVTIPPAPEVAGVDGGGHRRCRTPRRRPATPAAACCGPAAGLGGGAGQRCGPGGCGRGLLDELFAVCVPAEPDHQQQHDDDDRGEDDQFSGRSTRGPRSRRAGEPGVERTWLVMVCRDEGLERGGGRFLDGKSANGMTVSTSACDDDGDGGGVAGDGDGPAGQQVRCDLGQVLRRRRPARHRGLAWYAAADRAAVCAAAWATCRPCQTSTNCTTSRVSDDDDRDDDHRFDRGVATVRVSRAAASGRTRTVGRGVQARELPSTFGLPVIAG